MFGTIVTEAANSWTLLAYSHETFPFTTKFPGYLVGLLYSNRFGIRIPLGQGILGESTSSKFHFAVLGVSLGPVFLFGLSILAMVAACSSRASAILSATSFDLNADEDPTDEDVDIGMGDSIGVSASLGGEIFSGGKKCREIKHW
ncbi:hypothetical protein Tco_0704985 [Tanacetum coccineum]|uniref:Uncharacterized protein n=1 Tax=Tanacetum coccineum TaxID=301880 RepID=A0ABQ4Y399_9ASTR